MISKRPTTDNSVWTLHPMRSPLLPSLACCICHCGIPNRRVKYLRSISGHIFDPRPCFVISCGRSCTCGRFDGTSDTLELVSSSNSGAAKSLPVVLILHYKTIFLTVLRREFVLMWLDTFSRANCHTKSSTIRGRMGVGGRLALEVSKKSHWQCTLSLSLPAPVTPMLYLERPRISDVE